MKIKLNLVFTTSLTLGFLYTSGRSFLEGMVSETGFSIPYIGIEFTDYTYYGFLHSIKYLIWLVFTISCLYLLQEIYKRKKYFMPELYFIAHKIKHHLFQKGIFFNEIKVKNSISNNIVEKNIKSKEFKFINILTLWYLFNTSIPLIILLILYHWIDFYKIGEKERKATVLNGIHYLIKDKEKYFHVICGKDACIYQTKDFSKSISIKEYTIKTNSLKYTKTKNFINNKQLFPAFLLTEESKGKYNTYIYQIGITKELKREQLINNIKLVSKSKNIYISIINDKTIFLNKISNQSDSPIFLAFRLPANEKVDFIFTHKIPYNLDIKKSI